MIFYEFELFGWIGADFSRFDWICVDLGRLERITVDLEDRYKLIFVRFGKMATYLDGVWEDLDGFERL